MNGGQYLSKDVRLQLTNQTNSMCVCPDGYAGDRCQYEQRQTRIDISFHSQVNIPPLLSVHLIAVQLEKSPKRTSIMKKIRFDQYSLTFFTSFWFNIAIAQMFDKYYMIIFQEKLVTLTNISTEMISSRRCRSISELFNETFVKTYQILSFSMCATTGSEIHQQSTIVKVAIALTITIFIFGFISILLSLITFQEEETRSVGCGLYLFASSIISLNIVIVFTKKFWLLLASQMGSINNRSFLYIQYISIDYLLRSLLSISNWLSACVAIERAVNVSLGIKFNKIKSKKIAKWMILIVILFTSCTYIYDPLHRDLIDDEDEQRTWCVTKYSSSVQ
jgi:hypothetical protein